MVQTPCTLPSWAGVNSWPNSVSTTRGLQAAWKCTSARSMKRTWQPAWRRRITWWVHTESPCGKGACL